MILRMKSYLNVQTHQMEATAALQAETILVTMASGKK